MFSTSNIFLLIAVGLGLAWVARRYLARNKQGPQTLIIYDGRTIRIEKVKVVSEGVQAINGEKIYPAGNLHSVLMPDGSTYHIFGADHIALAEHEALEVARLVMVPRMLFTSGGEFKKWIEYAALIIPLAAALWLTFKVGDMQSSLNRLDANVQLVQKVLSSPLSVAPKEPDVKP